MSDSKESQESVENDLYDFKSHYLFDAFAKTKSNKKFLSLGVFLVALLVRLCTGMSPYSGMGVPPMYGDFEAQRHWMEVTTNLPISEWYQNTTDNDLQYWGLDYPPITAYHSYICAFFAKIFYPPMIELHTSRGIENESVKFFMRMTVIISDALFFIPSVFVFFKIFYSQKPYSMRIVGTLAVLLSPLFVIIDHGHFQYNCVALGLTLWAINAMLTRHHYIATVLFMCAVYFKINALYFSIPFFCYCIGNILRLKGNKNRIVELLSLAFFVIVTTIVVFAPWIYIPLTSSNDTSVRQSMGAVIDRMFPFGRGLFEDKVANLWCATNIIVKWRERFGSAMKVISAVATVLACLPSSVMLIVHPTRKHFIYSLCTCAFAFFGLSFQVHEKNILFPMLPLTLLCLESPIFIGGITWVATFSLLPLLRKDGLLYYYWLLQSIFFALVTHIQPLNPFKPTIVTQSQPTSPNRASPSNRSGSDMFWLWTRAPPMQKLEKFWIMVPLLTVILYVACEAEFSEMYPDIGTYIIMIFCCGAFVCAYLMVLAQQFQEFSTDRQHLNTDLSKEDKKNL